MTTLYYSIELTQNNRIGEGGGVINSANDTIAALAQKLAQCTSFDPQRYKIISFSRSSPKPGTHYQYKLQIEVLDKEKEKQILFTELAQVEDEMGEKEFKKWQRVKDFGVEGESPSSLIWKALDIRNKLKSL